MSPRPDAREEVGARAAVEHVGARAGDERVARAPAVDDAGALDRVVLARRALHGAVAPQVDVHRARPARVRDRAEADDDVRPRRRRRTSRRRAAW